MRDRLVRERCPSCEKVDGMCFDIYGQCDGKIVYKYRSACGCVFTIVEEKL
jgi:hypothetical protein